MQDCIFCKIVEGKVKSWKVYENDLVCAFLDKHPINPGHILVVPKHHEPFFNKLPLDLYSQLMVAVHEISNIVEKTYQPKRVGLVVAGFGVPHTHVHIIPMHKFHDITSESLLKGEVANPSPEELDEVAKKIQETFRKL